MRVNDEEVRRALTWARNYGEIESFKVVQPSGRKWLVRTTTQTTVSGAEISFTEHHAVPREMVFTGREALAFAYGLAIAGAHHGGRQPHATREWGW